ncbi:MAG: 4a-hydroxytetrahydrobiopterin dehydratase [Amycolatopsis sp.]|jgi:4a-hydroxytetrahydrobiopterin dehydratase|nr:4a-hydroxytetrahydrobiopterin dehydratase [Amycolatopsis sp.]
MDAMAELLTDEQIASALEAVPLWTRDGYLIERAAELATFPQAIAAVDAVAEIAEAADHHPDMDIRWRKVVFRLSTHSAGGLTSKDFDLAAGIDRVLAGM